jgi:hypothetical protein
MASIVIAGDTSGTVTLAAPATAGTTTLTLPTTNGTVLTSASSVTSGQLPAGTVLQVVSANHSTQVSSSSSTYADTGLSASITPTSATSKILVIVHQTGLFKAVGNTRVTLRLLRSSTTLVIFEWGAGTTDNSDTISPAGSGTTFLDSPATTSSVTYKTQLASTANTAEVRVNLDSNSTSTITLMEIAA